ncbi:hypothetical protein [Hyphomicrobium sp.]|uniref:hypothetical protein n=1 Tax=Hyphomicrobium sp. TaxID=82 RepID=UPI002D768175|nr:hypothetical protein [Hyphomicrobium sp.]HET6390355.1 hypothetical protein [Hyphomicrobium sp.]
MHYNLNLTLSGKKILIVKGSLLETGAIATALAERGAKVVTATNLISAFSLIEREAFDGAVIDQGLHNEAFDLCAELKSLNVPYVLAQAPHELQKPASQRSAASDIAELLAERLSVRRASARSGLAVRYPAAKGMASMAVMDPARF